MGEWLTTLIEQKAVSDAGNGEISGLASVYGNVDLQDDVMEPGALAKTTSDWSRSKAKLPLLDWHGESLRALIGSVNELRSTAQGLWFKAGFASTPAAQQARHLAQEGHLTGVSIGYLPVRAAWKTVAGRQVRSLQEARLLEISLTPVPANPEAQLASVKAVTLDAKAAKDAKAVSDTPWGQFSEGDYTPEQWRRACLVDTGQGDPAAKGRYKLPVREPSGTLNRNGVHAAAGGHGIGAVVGISPEVRRAAARALVALYHGQLGEGPPESLMRLAGMMAASIGLGLDGLAAAVKTAALLPDAAYTAALAALLADFEPATLTTSTTSTTSRTSEAAGAADGPPTAATAAPTDAAATDVAGAAGGTAQGAATGTPTGTPPSPPRLTPREYADQIARNAGPADGSPATLDALEAEIRQALAARAARGGQP